MKLLNKVYSIALLFMAVGLGSCQSGLTYEEAPESVYTEVGVSSFNVKSRELFNNQIYAVNWDKWVENYISTVVIAGSSEYSWKNNTGSDYTLEDGTVVKAGEEIKLKGKIVTEDNADAPEGKLYVMNVYVPSTAVYKTANKGYLFDGSKFTGDFTLINPESNRSQQVELPIKKTELIVEFYLVDAGACTVEPLDGAPKLGIPGDFTSPRRYLVRNNLTHRPDGVEESRRMYEVRLQFLP